MICLFPKNQCIKGQRTLAEVSFHLVPGSRQRECSGNQMYLEAKKMYMVLFCKVGQVCITQIHWKILKCSKDPSGLTGESQCHWEKSILGSSVIVLLKANGRQFSALRMLAPAEPSEETLKGLLVFHSLYNRDKDSAGTCWDILIPTTFEAECISLLGF
jgi:hypothetical protein